MKKRYEAVYVTPNFCDGFWDNEETGYLSEEEVKDKIYKNLEDEEIEEILNRTEQIKEEKEEMSQLTLALEGLGLILLGICRVLWLIAQIISSAYISIYIINYMGLIGTYWWAGVILVFSIFIKILFFGNLKNSYSELVDKYSEKTKTE